MNAQSFSRPAKYNVHNLPWRKHPLDPDGRMIVIADRWTRYSIAQTKFTEDYKYGIRVENTDTGRISRRYKTGPALARWLATYGEGDLCFNDDAYSREVAA